MLRAQGAVVGAPNWLAPEIARGVLRFLAAHQADRVDAASLRVEWKKVAVAKKAGLL